MVEIWNMTYLIFADMVNGAGKYSFSSDRRCYVSDGSRKFWWLQRILLHDATPYRHIRFACGAHTYMYGVK